MQKQRQQKIVQVDQFLYEEASTALQKLKKLTHHPDWVMFNENPCKMFKMTIGGRLLSKGESTIAMPMQQLCDRLADESILKDLNPLLAQMETLQKFSTRQGNSAIVNYMRYKGIWPVQDRDFVNVSVQSKGNKICYIASMASQYPHKLCNKATRAVCHIAGYTLQKIDQQNTRLIYISDVDLGGWIPHMLQNKVNQWQASMPVQIKKVLFGQPGLQPNMDNEQVNQNQNNQRDDDD